MNRHHVKSAVLAIGWLFILVWTVVLPAAQSSSDRWTPKEMGEPGDAEGASLNLPLLPTGEVYPSGFYCDKEPSACQFQLRYFLAEGFDLSKKQRLNILFIPGGPGAIVDTGSRTAALRLLEKKHNVVYFHPRGMAASAIDGRKQYDQFLRADYVVEDIERLRQAVLKGRSWDAIYAHSWGTVIAQRYAANYGKPKNANPYVKSLILSGPVDRHRTDTHVARTRMTIENLKAIFSYYRTQGAANCKCASAAYLKSRVVDYSEPQITIFDNRLGPSDNFCFLKADAAERIAQQLGKIVPQIDENYGSADFIVDNYAQLKKDDQSFQSGLGKFPIEFFAAVRYLQMAGAPEKNSLVFVADSRNRINAALVIAYYLTPDQASRCSLKSGLFSGSAADCEYCERFKAAREELRVRLGGRESRRGSYVFGVYDGVARWISVMMGEKGCFYGKDIEYFANQPGDAKEFGRKQAKKLGIVADEKICPWNPADYRHEVPTLLIKGSRDTVVAGCQAEDFLTHGLADGSRVLLEFRGLGHDLSVANLYEGSDPSIWSKRFVSLLEDFIKMSSTPEQFRGDAKVKAKLQKLKVRDRTRDPNIIAECGKDS
jgi:pimeloyl-ACP methyl ester carboxylesterase